MMFIYGGKDTDSLRFVQKVFRHYFSPFEYFVKNPRPYPNNSIKTRKKFHACPNVSKFGLCFPQNKEKRKNELTQTLQIFAGCYDRRFGRIFSRPAAQCRTSLGRTSGQGAIPHPTGVLHHRPMALRPQSHRRFAVRIGVRRVPQDPRLRQALLHPGGLRFAAPLSLRHRRPDSRRGYDVFPLGYLGIQDPDGNGCRLAGLAAGHPDGLHRGGNARPQ